VINMAQHNDYRLPNGQFAHYVFRCLHVAASIKLS
jgi:hypothetical protein